MYTHDLACIRIGDQITETFAINQGVKQGCILSPLLFNIFISDLSKSLDEGESTPLKIDDYKTLNSLIWADDLLLFSETENALKNILKNLENYTKVNLIRVNLDKTKCMIFNKTGRIIRRNFWFEQGKIEVVREYKYLGFLITPSFNLHTALTDLKDRGLRAYGALKTKLGSVFRKHVTTTTYLFDSLVKPVLLYASDFWACLKIPKTNPIENLHIKFCKDLLGLQIRAVNLGALMELGRITLCIYGRKNAAKNWDRICLKKQANNIIQKSYQNSLQNGWASSMKSCFSSVGLLNVFLNERAGRQAPHTQLFLREKDIFQQTALTGIQNMSKLRTFSFLKRNITFE